MKFEGKNQHGEVETQFAFQSPQACTRGHVDTPLPLDHSRRPRGSSVFHIVHVVVRALLRVC